MNTLKSLVVFAVLGVIGYAVYLGLGGQLNVSVGLSPDDSHPAPGGDMWNSDGPPPPLGSLASPHDQGEHHDHRSHGDRDGQAPSLTSSSTETASSAAAPSFDPSDLPPASTAAPAAYRQEIEPTPYAPKASSSSASASTSSPAATASTPHAGATASGESPVTPSTTATATAAGPSAYQKQAPDESSHPSETKPPSGSLEARRPASIFGKSEVGASYIFESAMKDARQKIDAGQPEDALFLLSMLHEDSQLSEEHRAQLLSLLDQVAGTVIYSREHLMEPAYAVKANERLADIAAAYNVSPGLLAKINGIAETASLPPGTSLKVVRGPFNAVINTTSRELTLFVQSRYAGRFPVHVGPEFPLTAGSAAVIGKTRQHSQYDGHAWIGLGSSPAVVKPASGPTVASQEFGIVGMKDPTAVDSGTSRKNIGVTPSHADDLYDILSQGSTVTVLR